MEQNSPAKELENFLNFIDQCVQEYKAAYENVNEEDRRLQDLVHAMEFAVDKSERIVKFFEDQKNRDTLNRMRQLLGQQRKEEEYLDGERVYKPRVGKG